MNNIALISAVTIDSGNIALPPGSARELRRADNLTRMAVAAVSRCLGQAGGAAGLAELDRLAICVGHGAGAIETNLAFVESFFAHKDMCGSPTLFSHSVHNTVAGYISRIYGIEGPSMTLTDFAWPFVSALEQAVCLIRAGMAPAALVVGCEGGSRFLQEIAVEMAGRQVVDMSRAMAAAWLVAAPGTLSVQSAGITAVNMTPLACRPEELLLRLSEKYPEIDGDTSVLPWGYALSLNRAANEALHLEKDIHWCASADFGCACVDFQG